MRKLLAVICSLFAALFTIKAQTPQTYISLVMNRFDKVKDYAADIKINFNLPGVNLTPVAGSVFYKAPDKFRVKTKGVVFLPKQSPHFALSLLRDSTAYTAVSSGSEIIAGVPCIIVNVIPNAETDLILGKLWIDPSRGLILKSQLTTRSGGTVLIDNYFGPLWTHALPDRIVFTVDMARFKVPKALAVDINTRTSKPQSTPGTGTIELQFSNYRMNQHLSDKVFTEE
ncbi:MAG: hypothetical protein NZM35_11610 [Chitinophagales bacterium]|nr:hypothetical protein [Chitinophagales bacterium]MDW8420020.1 hypothetical protein [Chitinophagales bacterium]